MGLRSCGGQVQEPGREWLCPFPHSIGQESWLPGWGCRPVAFAIEWKETVLRLSSHCCLEITHSLLNLSRPIMGPTLCCSPPAAPLRALETAVHDLILSCNLSRPQTMANVLLTPWGTSLCTGGLCAHGHALIISVSLPLLFAHMVGIQVLGFPGEFVSMLK